MKLYFKKSLAFVNIFLFIGVGVIPSICGSVEVVIINNDPPAPPIISGPTKVIQGKLYIFNLTSTDPDNDPIYYYVDWGDGNITDWVGPYNSGMDAKISHTWLKEDTFIIKAKSRDRGGAESDWATLSVIVPRTRIAVNNFKEVFLEFISYGYISKFSLIIFILIFSFKSIGKTFNALT